MNRIFFYSKTIAEDTIVLSEEESHHCIKVLRHQKNDLIHIFYYILLMYPYYRLYKT
ncbi:MAG: hypothetical protein QM536_09760 [Chitinophagaceae bacterium]|nr:hypothetical protein [Chitinophagaceae bacterium]